MASAPRSKEAGYIIDLGNGLGIRTMRETDNISMSLHMNNANILSKLRDRIPVPYTESDATVWIQLNHQPSKHVPTGPWHSKAQPSTGPPVPKHYAITFDDEAIGGIGLEFGQDVYFRSAELGYWLAERHWGQGVMSRVVPAFVRWTWEQFGILLRLNAETNEENLGSRKVLERSGFLLEGRRPDFICKAGVLSNALFWGAPRPVPT